MGKEFLRELFRIFFSSVFDGLKRLIRTGLNSTMSGEGILGAGGREERQRRALAERNKEILDIKNGKISDERASELLSRPLDPFL
jgi:hypothetical protein